MFNAVYKDEMKDEVVDSKPARAVVPLPPEDTAEREQEKRHRNVAVICVARFPAPEAARAPMGILEDRMERE